MQYLLCRRAPAADGVELATDVYLPDGPGPFPTILVRTPYHRTGQQNSAGHFVVRGYALVIQDCRGKFDSDGVFRPLRDEADDGHAALDWIANQHWCNGRIGMWGRSYLGIVQVPAASGGHEALKCIAPSVAPGSFFRDWLRYDGCFALGNAVRWSVTHASCRTQPPGLHLDWNALCQLPGPEAIARAAGCETPALNEWAAHDTADQYWDAIDQCRMHPAVRVPGLHAGGWFDHLTRSQYEAYRNIRDHGATPQARAGQRLLIGPWGHQTTGNTGPAHCRYGDWDFGPAADLSVLANEFQFLDFHLRDMDNGYTAHPPVRVFLMGQNRWVGLDDWPPPEATEHCWHLDSKGTANMRSGDGTLTREAPAHDYADSFTHDPAAPVPTRGGAVYWGLENVGPVDMRPVLDRTDVLYYRSPALSKAVTVIGEPGLDLHVSSDAADTDFIARLCVEEPSGAVTCLCLGSLRCRYRNGFSTPEPLQAGTPTAIRLRLGEIGYTFPAGSRIGLMVTSSDFPRILPHPGSMAPPWQESAPRRARNSVLHGRQTLSCLRLPVVPL